MALVGWVDACSPAGVEGWASETTRPTQPVAVDIYVGSRCHGQVLADRHRPDLQAAGYGDGRKAFSYRFPPAALAGEGPLAVEVCFAGTRQVLPNGSFTLNGGAAPAAPATAADGANPWN